MSRVSRSKHCIEFKMSVEPRIYSYSSSEAPTFQFLTTYHPDPDSEGSKRPITVFTMHTIFDPLLCLHQLYFQVTDLSVTPPRDFTYTSIRLQRPAVSRLSTSPDAVYFTALKPDEPLAITIPFCSRGRAPPALPWGDDRRLEYYRGEMRQRPPLGVDGLEIGHRYRIIAVKIPDITWWRWGSKEDVLETEGYAPLGDSDGGPISVYAQHNNPACEFEIIA